jgi:hypothetical protein
MERGRFNLPERLLSFSRVLPVSNLAFAAPLWLPIEGVATVNLGLRTWG